MKKNILIILIILIILLLYPNIYISPDSKDNEAINFTKYDSNIYIDETVNKKDIDNIYYYLKLVPEWIIDEYQGRILITDDEVNIIVGSDLKMTAAYDVNSQDIYLNINNMCDLLHELGHFYYRTILTDKSELQELLNTEGKDFHPHYRSNENEFFAECFRRTLLNDKDFINQSPKSYEFIIENLNKEI
jgi:hypothetical protein